MMRLARISLALTLALLDRHPPVGSGEKKGRGGRGAGGSAWRGWPRISERTLGRLNLTDAQMEAAKKAIAKHAEKIKELSEEVQADPGGDDENAPKRCRRSTGRQDPGAVDGGVSGGQENALPKEKVEAAEALTRRGPRS